MAPSIRRLAERNAIPAADSTGVAECCEMVARPSCSFLAKAFPRKMRMERAAIVVQRAWNRRRGRRCAIWLRGAELAEEAERRERLSLLTDDALDGECLFDRRCACYDTLARRWNLPSLEQWNALNSVPYD